MKTLHNILNKAAAIVIGLICGSVAALPLAFVGFGIGFTMEGPWGEILLHSAPILGLAIAIAVAKNLWN